VEKFEVQRLEEQTDHILFQMRLQSSMWRRMLGQQPALNIDIRALAPSAGANMPEVVLSLRTVGCAPDDAGHALLKWGPSLIESLRTALQVGPERRKQPRLPFERQITARPLLSAGRVGEAIRGQAKDLSVAGLGLYLPVAPPAQLLVQLPR